jgi:hypothetical protein
MGKTKEKTGVGENKLSGDQQLELCELLARGYSIPVIIDHFKDEYDIKISYNNIWTNYKANKKWKPVIERIREERLKDLISHPAYTDANRLDAAWKLFQECMRFRVKQIWFDAFGREIARREGRDTLGAIKALAEARTIVKGEKGTEITINNWQSIVEAAHAKQRDNRQCAGNAGTIPEGSGVFQRKGIGDAPLGIEGPRTDPDNGKLKRSLKNGSQVMQRSREVEVSSGSGGLVSHKSLPGKGNNNGADLYAG